MEEKSIRVAGNATVVGVPFEEVYSFGRNVYKWSTGTKRKIRGEDAKALRDAARPEFKEPQAVRLRRNFIEDYE